MNEIRPTTCRLFEPSGQAHKIFAVKTVLILFALLFASCSSTKIVTTDLRADIESSGLEMNNSSFRYYIDRDVELKASTRAMTMNKLGEGVKATVEKTRRWTLCYA